MDTYLQLTGMDLNENGEWVDVPLENVVPKWLYESLMEDEDEDEDEDIGDDYCVPIPYIQDDFKAWLMNKRGISAKSADDYIRAYCSGYESAFEEVGIDLYNLLKYIFEGKLDFEGTLDETESDLTEEDAPKLVEIYVETMLEDEDAYTKAELRAMKHYHAFIVEVAETLDKTYINKKSRSLPNEDEFRSWLENENKMNYDNATKIVSSVKRMDLELPSLVSEPMTFLDVLRALPAAHMRPKYLNLVRTKQQAIYHRINCSDKTLQNGFSNINYYINFLNSKNIGR